MKTKLTLLIALLLAPLAALHAADKPPQATPTSDPAGQAAAAAAILRDATAVWSMAAETAASVQLKGDAKLGVALGGSFRSGSLAHGGDGVVAELAGGCIEGARDLRLEGSALTLLLRLRNPTNTWTPGELFSKNGGPDKMVFNLYAKTGIIGVELGVDGVKGIAARVTMPQDNTFMRSGKWNDIIVRYDGRDLTLFANGLVWGKVRGKPGPLRQGNHEPVLIGSNFAGQIDHAALWARALSDAEIVTLCGGEAEMKPRLYESRYELAPEQPSREAKAIVSQPRVQFRTSNSVLQKAFNEAEKQAKLNVRDFGKYKIMVEGQGYRGVWLETQPMGGCMYAKRDIEVARNNQLIFMDFQREDGRLPGAIGFLPPFYKQGQMVIRYQELQGDYLPLEAFDVYYWIGKDREYLKKLYTALEKFDNYFWKTRDSDHNGCLESYCGGDTGEDNSGRFSIRFGRAHHTWPFDYPPTYDSPMPMESMDMMSYSFGNRAILAQIAEILQNGQSEYWRSKALEVQKKLKEYLWIPERHACFDRDKNNAVMDVLCHNNLRCMYFGSFDQQMAEEFIKYHLMNPKEFWTPLPLPSIAANDPAFKNIPGNNWSGKSQGLTFQRSI
ncbi:MAG: hypothetical protein KGQ89_09455, partial [Verrucomicrobia bacterium]|nr:hypothetical protein [Verrucomicrobiota bacterium]